MSGKYFIDTNIFVYSFDDTSRAKRKKSRDIIGRALAGNDGLISYQVVQEFLSLATRKFQKPFSSSEMIRYLQEVLEPLCEAHSSIELYRRAVHFQNENALSFYDALIVAAAAESKCRILYSEDLQHGQRIAGVKILNPYR